MRRALVLTDEAARHPFRIGLAPHVRTTESHVPARFEWLIRAVRFKVVVPWQ